MGTAVMIVLGLMVSAVVSLLIPSVVLGWIFMLIAGACGLHWAFVPLCWLVGLGAAVLLK